MQISMFDGSQRFKITKPIRLLEIFGGYGSQSLALKYLGVPFEHHFLSEWAIPSIQAYKDIHFSDDNTDYSEGIADEEIISFLEGRVSRDYSNPLTREQVIRLGEKQRRTIFNNMKASRNIGSVCLAKGSDLNITETDKYCYILAYSFPCQDLSSAGLGKGMARDSSKFENDRNYRIRKLTPKECFRLMGVKDEDYENCAKNQSNASLYHLAGDSIIVNVLMAIFSEML